MGAGDFRAALSIIDHRSSIIREPLTRSAPANILRSQLIGPRGDLPLLAATLNKC